MIDMPHWGERLLVERFRNGRPLAEPAPMYDWYWKSYTDFPRHH